MKIAKNKTMAILIAAFLTISMGTSMMLSPSANAHTPAWQIPTQAFVNVAPNPAGLGQQVTIGMWLQIPPPSASAATGDRWHNYKVTVTHPDGTTETLGPLHQTTQVERSLFIHQASSATTRLYSAFQVKH